MIVSFPPRWLMKVRYFITTIERVELQYNTIFVYWKTIHKTQLSCWHSVWQSLYGFVYKYAYLDVICMTFYLLLHVILQHAPSCSYPCLPQCNSDLYKNSFYLVWFVQRCVIRVVLTHARYLVWFKKIDFIDLIWTVICSCF